VGIGAFYLQNIWLLLGTLMLMSTQSTFFSPAKYGYIPEKCHSSQITWANSMVSLVTMASIILGTAFAGLIFHLTGLDATSSALVTVILALLGWGFSRKIPAVPATGQQRQFPANPLKALWRDYRFLKAQKPLFLASLAISYFWLLGLFFQTNILIYGKSYLEGIKNAGSGESSMMLSLLPAVLGIGIALGALLARRWSDEKVELGLVPLGGLGLALTGFLLIFSTFSLPLTMALLFAGGVCGGLYTVPLNAYLQFKAGENEKGRVIAANGMLNGIFLVIGTCLYWLMAVLWDFSPLMIFAVISSLTLVVVAIIIYLIPEYLVRFVLWLLTHTFYRVKVIGRENVPDRGAVLFTPNHVSFIDALLVGTATHRFIRFIMLDHFYRLPLINWFCKLMEAIPIRPGNPDSVDLAIDQARGLLENGKPVCIFPEGKLTRDGEISPFRKGCERIADGLAPVIVPVYIHNLWGSVFSYKGGKVLLKKPRSFRSPVTIYFGEPMEGNATALEIEAAVRKLAMAA
ncbi:MAG TPA: MFS transporter, partial [Calditrichia bacterium]|nr:MFS transporter [Calditrichia bacterium]